jgi:hypothetical protein
MNAAMATHISVSSKSPGNGAAKRKPVTDETVAITTTHTNTRQPASAHHSIKRIGSSMSPLFKDDD